MGKCVGGYKIVKTIGRGSNSVVKFAVHIETGREYAIRVFPRSFLDDPSVLERIKQLNTVRHPNSARLIEVLRSETKGYLVLELAEDGEMFSVLCEAGLIREPPARIYFQQLVDILCYFSQRNIVHGNIKPENMLMDKNRRLKLTDFVLSGVDTNNDYTGINYLAPEILDGQKPTAASDIWSAGLILYTMLTSKVPFEANSREEIIAQIKANQLDFSSVPPPVLPLIRKMCILDPSLRLSIQQVSADKWLTEIGDNTEELQIKDVVEEEMNDLISKEAKVLTAFELVGHIVNVNVSPLIDSSIAKRSRTSFYTELPIPQIHDKIINELNEMKAKVVEKVPNHIKATLKINYSDITVVIDISQNSETTNIVQFWRIAGNHIDFYNLYQDVLHKSH